MMVLGIYCSDHEDIPLEERRGLGGIDNNARYLAVKASVQEVAQALSKKLEAVCWQQNVYNQTIEIQRENLFIFQLRSHFWTIIQSPYWGVYSFQHHFEEEAQLLSRLLDTKALFCQRSDTASYIGYHLYEKGESIERLYFSEDSDLNRDPQDKDYIPGMYQFSSQLRQLQEEYILLNGYRIVNKFLEEQALYIPDLIWDDTCQKGQQVTVRIRNLDQKSFDRIDYLGWN